MKHQEKVWKGNCLAATYLNTGWAVYVTSGHCITACNSGITIFVFEKLVLWKGQKSKGSIFTWLHWHMVMRTFHLWLQSRGPSWPALGFSSAWRTRRSPWPSCRYPGTSGHPQTVLPPASERDTSVTFPDSWGKSLARINRQTNELQTHWAPSGKATRLWAVTLLQSQSLNNKAYWPKPTEATLQSPTPHSDLVIINSRLNFFS